MGLSLLSHGVGCVLGWATIGKITCVHIGKLYKMLSLGTTEPDKLKFLNIVQI